MLSLTQQSTCYDVLVLRNYVILAVNIAHSLVCFRPSRDFTIYYLLVDLHYYLLFGFVRPSRDFTIYYLLVDLHYYLLFGYLSLI